MKQNRFKGEMDAATMVIGNFNILTFKNGQNINKETENLNSTIDELDLIYNIGHSTQQQYLNIFISRVLGTHPWVDKC